MSSKSRNVDQSSTNVDGAPLPARSIVLSLLLGSHPAEMRVSALLEFCGLFGISAGTVRTALSRMVERGELTTDEAKYRLSGRLVGRQSEQDTGRTRSAVEWDASWYVVIVTADRRTVADRRSFRSRAVGAKLGELRADLWMRPTNLDIPDDLADVLVSRGPLLGADGVEVARSLWDLGAIDDRSRALTDELSNSGRSIARSGPGGLPATFVALAQALRHLRVEPQLPEQLHSPATGDELRATYRAVERDFRTALEAFLRHD